jgi:hypothetical protein
MGNAKEQVAGGGDIAWLVKLATRLPGIDF